MLCQIFGIYNYFENLGLLVCISRDRGNSRVRHLGRAAGNPRFQLKTMKTTALMATLLALASLKSNAASSYDVSNESGTPIVVIMDTRREIHGIGAAGNATFVKANPFDRPTFKVYWDRDGDGQPDNPKQIVASRKANYWEAIKADGSYIFNGSKLTKK